MEAILEWLNDEDLFLIKYGLIISNFITILSLIIMQKLKRQKNKPSDQPYKNVLFVTAHPDDEAMFFIPTIETLKQQHYILHLLCLSNGNAANLGKLREDELMKCCKFLGISKVKIIDDPEVQDGMNVKWPKKKLQLIISSYVSENDIQGIITFDNYGISKHINHICVYKAVKRIKKELSSNKDNQIKIFTLESTNVVRKYISILDFFISAVYSDELVIQLNPILAWKAMAIHQTQFVWFRKLFVIFSRYAYVNTLNRIL